MQYCVKKVTKNYKVKSEFKQKEKAQTLSKIKNAGYKDLQRSALFLAL